MEVIFNYDLLLMKIKITYLILSPLVICYFRLILIFDLDHFLCDLPYLCCSFPLPSLLLSHFGITLSSAQQQRVYCCLALLSSALLCTEM